ncbi:MAG: hypothetical protein GX882_07980, partial [Methanomicrobiales archaeon]|nr:hypothetical protein [Methanomicrobiales archaeon]
ARPYWNKLGIFCIILTYDVQPDNQQLVVGIDPGSSFEGGSVVGTKETVLNGMSEAPKHVTKAVETRRTMRRARRHRKCWRRPARYNLNATFASEASLTGRPIRPGRTMRSSICTPSGRPPIFAQAKRHHPGPGTNIHYGGRAFTPD